MGKKYNNAISTSAGFKYNSPSPLDDRLTVETYADLVSDDFIKYVYDGMVVYVQNEDTHYKYNGSDWTEFGRIVDISMKANIETEPLGTTNVIFWISGEDTFINGLYTITESTTQESYSGTISFICNGVNNSIVIDSLPGSGFDTIYANDNVYIESNDDHTKLTITRCKDLNSKMDKFADLSTYSNNNLYANLNTDQYYEFSLGNGKNDTVGILQDNLKGAIELGGIKPNDLLVRGEKPYLVVGNITANVSDSSPDVKGSNGILYGCNQNNNVIDQIAYTNGELSLSHIYDWGAPGDGEQYIAITGVRTPTESSPGNQAANKEYVINSITETNTRIDTLAANGLTCKVVDTLPHFNMGEPITNTLFMVLNEFGNYDEYICIPCSKVNTPPLSCEAGSVTILDNNLSVSGKRIRVIPNNNYEYDSNTEKYTYTLTHYELDGISDNGTVTFIITDSNYQFGHLMDRAIYEFDSNLAAVELVLDSDFEFNDNGDRVYSGALVVNLIEPSYEKIGPTTVGQKTTNGGEIFNDYAKNIATAEYAHVEGHINKTVVEEDEERPEAPELNSDFAYPDGTAIHLEGIYNRGTGVAAHVGGVFNTATGNASSTEGVSNTNKGKGAHVEGGTNVNESDYSHTEGAFNYNYSKYGHVGGIGNITRADAQTIIGKYAKEGTPENTLPSEKTLFAVGNGTSPEQRSNAFAVYENGSISAGGHNIYPNSDAAQLFLRGVCIGDSITEGMFDVNGAPVFREGQTYPDYLKALMPNTEIINAGFTGDTAEGWWNHSANTLWVDNKYDRGARHRDKRRIFSWNYNNCGFDFAIIQLGINDGLITNKTDEEILTTFKGCLSNICNSLINANANIKIFIANILPYFHDNKEIYIKLNSVIQEVCVNKNAFLLDLTNKSDLTRANAVKYFVGHPNTAGYQKLAKEIYILMNQAIAEYPDSFVHLNSVVNPIRSQNEAISVYHDYSEITLNFKEPITYVNGEHLSISGSQGINLYSNGAMFSLSSSDVAGPAVFFANADNVDLGLRVTGIATPTEDADAVNKKYVTENTSQVQIITWEDDD